MQTPAAIPVGLATKLGVAGAAGAALIAAITAILGGDHTPETITGLISAAGLLYAVITGRMSQAAAAIAATPNVNEPDAPASS